MTKIEWTEKTWNPIVGCSIVSPGCTNCYAMKMAERIQAMAGDGLDDNGYRVRGPRPGEHYFGTTKVVNGKPVWTGRLALAPDHILLEPLRRKKPTTYFVNSMSDLFHEDVPDACIDRIFAVMALCPQHTFQVLTKRSARMLTYMASANTAVRVLDAVFAIADLSACFAARSGHPRPYEARPKQIAFMNDPDAGWPLPNVWLGVSAEDQKRADERIPDLLETPAAVRFVSAEPLIGPIDFTDICQGHWFCNPLTGARWHDSDEGIRNRIAKIDWAIVGGESGRGARPMHPDWARSIRDQCNAAGVAFFFKQWGEWAPQIGAVDGWTIGDDPEHSRFDHREWDEDEQRWSDVFRPIWCDFEDGNYDEEHTVSRLGKKLSGRLLDGREWNEMPGRAGKAVAA